MTTTTKTVQDWNLDDEAECREFIAATPAFGSVDIRRMGFRKRLLRKYALHKLMGMKFREEGGIPEAQMFEAVCDRLYSKMPEDIRW